MHSYSRAVINHYSVCFRKTKIISQIERQQRPETSVSLNAIQATNTQRTDF